MNGPLPSDDLSAHARALLIIHAPPPPPAWNRARIKAMFWGTGVYVLLYVFIAVSGVMGSGLLFLAMPLISAMTVAGLVSHKEHVWTTCWMSFCVNILASFLFLQEAAFCVAMAAPIFAAMCAAGALLVRNTRGYSTYSSPAASRRILSIFITLGILGYSAYDAYVMATGAPVRTVTSVIEVPADAAAVWRGLSFRRAPAAAIPLWLRLWIPRPNEYDFDGQGLGARRAVDFGEPKPGDDGDTPRGKVVYEITEWDEQRACTFRCVENKTKIATWLELLETRVELQPLGAPGSAPSTQVTLTTRYRSRLGPAPYFIPAMNAALRDMHAMVLEETREK